MSTPATSLEIVEIPIPGIAQPSHSLILAERTFMATLANAEKEAAGLATINDAVGAQAAASLQVRVTKAQKLLNDQRLALIRPYKALIDSINEAAKAPDARLDKIKGALSAAQTTFTQEQARIARDTEAKRLKDLAELEIKLAKERQEVADKAAAIAEQARKDKEAADAVREQARIAGIPLVEEAADESWSDEWEEAAEAPPQKTATELEIERVKFAPVVLPVKAQGVRTVTTLVPFVDNVNLLPDIFVDRVARIVAIRATFCAGYKAGDPIPVLAGCRFEVQTSTVSTGKGAF